MKKLFSLFTTIMLLGSVSAYCQDLKIVLDENFNDNSYGWDVDYDSQFNGKITDGMYVLTNNSQVDLLWKNSAEYDVMEDFTIETKFSFVEIGNGVRFYAVCTEKKTKVYGITLDNEKASPYLYSNGRAANGEIYENITVDDSFAEAGEDITFKVECKNLKEGASGHREITYYVNNTIIGIDNNVELSENMQYFGFLIANKTTIEVDYIKIYGTELKKEKLSEVQVAKSPLSTTYNQNDEIVTIKAGESIYGMVYMSKSFGDITGGYNLSMMEVVRVDGEAIGFYDWYMDGETIWGQGSTYEVEMAPQIADMVYPKEAFLLTKKLSELEPGIYDVTLAVVYQFDGMSSGNTLGEVVFKFDNTDEAGRNKFKEMVAAYRVQSIKNIKVPEFKMKDATIEANVKQAIVDADWPQTVQRVVIMGSDWEITYNQYNGAIMLRWINVAVVTKNSSGQCQIFYPIVYQDYTDSGTYTSKITIGSMHRIEQEMDCENVFK